MYDLDAHTTDDVDYKWRKTKANEGRGIEIVSNEMAQFELTGIETKLKDTKNSKGNMNFYETLFVHVLVAYNEKNDQFHFYFIQPTPIIDIRI